MAENHQRGYLLCDFCHRQIRRCNPSTEGNGDLNADFVYENKRYDINQLFFQHDPDSYFSLEGTLFLPDYLLDESRFNQNDDEQLGLSLDFANLELSDYPFFKEFKCIFSWTGYQITQKNHHNHLF